MVPFYESEAYRELAEAARAKDFARQARIVEQQIAATEGPEKAFWLHVRLGRRVSACLTPADFVALAPELEAILNVAPNDPSNIHSIALAATNIYIQSEQRSILARVLPLLRPYRQTLAGDWGVRQNVGMLFVKKRRWHSALRSLSLCLELFERQPKGEREAKGGYRYFVYAQRAIAAVAAHRYDTAAESIAGARAVMAQRPPGYFHPAPVGLAEAALAHARGEYQTARSFLQTANPTSNGSIPWLEFDFLLMAARIARSEGNRNSFAYFCDQARTLSVKYDMPLSAAALEAVANGAEY